MLWPLKSRIRRRVFCISVQRSGTKSVGQFFRDFGFAWAGTPADREFLLSERWYDGDYDGIFNSPAFQQCNAFEDAPWWFPGFYKVLFHRFPDSRFILLTRDSAKWFRSMCSLAGGNTIGRGYIHCRLYRREAEYHRLVHDGLLDEAIESELWGPKTMKLAGHAAHYQSLYELHNHEVTRFFAEHAPDSLFTAELEGVDTWRNLGTFLGISVPDDYTSHQNRTVDRVA